MKEVEGKGGKGGEGKEKKGGKKRPFVGLEPLTIASKLAGNCQITRNKLCPP